MTQDDLKETRSLYSDIDGCITELLKARTDKEQEPEVDLEEEIDRFENWMETYNQADYPTSYTTRDIARHFAEWQKSKMLEGAVAVEVVGEKRDLRLIDSTQRCLFNAERGDWLKIIIVKED